MSEYTYEWPTWSTPRKCATNRDQLPLISWNRCCIIPLSTVYRSLVLNESNRKLRSNCVGYRDAHVSSPRHIKGSLLHSVVRSLHYTYIASICTTSLPVNNILTILIFLVTAKVIPYLINNIVFLDWSAIEITANVNKSWQRSSGQRFQSLGCYSWRFTTKSK